MSNEGGMRWEREELAEVDSTNRLAMERVLERWKGGESAEGLVIVAERQTAGRGQHGRAWESPLGGVYLSVVLEAVPVEWRERLALVAGVVVMDALKECGGLEIRWPNDLLLGGQKVAGILCEGLAQGNRWGVVVGMGVNVEAVEFSQGLRGAATSLWARGVRLSKGEVVERVLEQWARTMRERPAMGVIVERVRAVDALRGRKVRLAVGKQVLEGEGAGIDDEGRLLLRMPDGETRVFDRGSIAHG